MSQITEHDILFQDDTIIVINKPVGLPIHKNDFMAKDADYVLKIVGDMLQRRIFNVHRLDAKTSGELVMAFDSKTAGLVSRQFEKREDEKTYQVLVRENPGEGVFDQQVVDKTKKKRVDAETHYKTLETVKTDIVYREFENINLSLVEAKPKTGRWHQLRQHFAGQRFDIIGDTRHGDFALNRIITERTGAKRLLLHASAITFKHPETEEQLTFEAPLPAEFNQVLNYFRENVKQD